MLHTRYGGGARALTPVISAQFHPDAISKGTRMRKFIFAATASLMVLAVTAPAHAAYGWRYGACAAYRDYCVANNKNNVAGCEAAYRKAMASGDEYRGFWNNYWACSKQ